jgi:ABC-type transport system involved in multi-copper enzyme maturation permease subunit
MNRQKYNFAMGVGYQNTHLKGDLITQNAKIDRSFENFLPVARFNYDFSNYKHLRFDYETSMQEPSIQQLQPAVINTDPLNISVGNPELRPGYAHNLSANFTTFNPSKFINFFAFVTAAYTTNAIANSQTVDPTNFVRTSKPVNVRDNLRLNGNLNLGIPIKKLNSRFNLGPTFSITNGINLLNDLENRTKQQTIGGTARYNYTFKEILKSKILVNVFFVGLALMAITYVATEFTYGVPEKVAIDFGMGTLSLSSLGISLFLGVGLLSKEIESRTLYMVISRSVPRFSFILGKIGGLLGIQLINMALLSGMVIMSVVFLGGKIDPLIYWAIGFTFLESVMLLLIVILASLLLNNILATLFSVIILLSGHAVKEALSLSSVKDSAILSKALEAYHFILPGFYKLNLKDFVVYNSSLSDSYLFSTLAYSIFYSCFLLTAIIFIFNRKNLD